MTTTLDMKIGNKVPATAIVTPEGYVAPSTFSKVLHLGGVVLGAFLVLLPTLHRGFQASTSLGELAQYLGGGGVAIGTLFSYSLHEKATNVANAQTANINTTALLPEVEHAVNTVVLPFINQDFPNFASDLTIWRNALESKLSQPTQVDINALLTLIEPEFDKWFLKLRAAIPPVPTSVAPIAPAPIAPKV